MGIGDVSAWVKRLTRLSSQLGLDGPGGFETDDQIKEVTAKIKQMADIRPLAIDDADSIIHAYHLGLQGQSEQQNASEQKEA